MKTFSNFRFIAVMLIAIALSIISFTQPMNAASLKNFQSDKNTFVSASATQTSAASIEQSTNSVDQSAVLPSKEKAISFGVTSQYLPPISRKISLKTNQYQSLNRPKPEQPPNRS